jgi:hypothetical protein
MEPLKRMDWPILPTEERTQSNTYMPLICSVIDGFEVTFPPGYEELFNGAIKKYKDFGFGSAVGKLEFKDFHSFQEFLRKRVNTEIGSLSREDFFSACDNRESYHVVPRRQTAIISGARLEAFFGIFINDLMTNLGDKSLSCTLIPASEARAAAHGEAALRESPPRWYFKNDAGEDTPYSDEDNSKIMSGYENDYNPDLGKYKIDVGQGFQINKQTGFIRPIVLKGGKTKKSKKSKKTKKTKKKNKKRSMKNRS